MYLCQKNRSMAEGDNVMQPDSQWAAIQAKLIRGRASMEGETEKTEQIPEPVSVPAPVERKRTSVKERKANAKASPLVRRSILLPADFSRKLKCVLAAKGMDLSGLVRKLLEDYVNKSLKEDSVKEFLSQLK